MKIEAEILRDLGKIPSVVTIKKGRREIKVEFDPQKGFNIEGPHALLPTISEVLRMIYPVQTILSVRGMNWFDRNPVPKSDSYDDTGETPHSATSRLKYKVPSDRIAMVELLQVWIRTVSNPTTVGLAAMSWYYTPLDGSTKKLVQVRLRTDVLGVIAQNAIGTTLMLFEGDEVELITIDSSVGGSRGYFGAYKITEFDA